MPSSSNRNGPDIEGIIQRAWADSTFRERLLANPKAVIEDALGVTLPDEVNVYIHEESDTDIHLVLPRRPAYFGDQLGAGPADIG